MLKPQLLKGSLFNDERGTLSFINDFSFMKNKIKRFYIVKNYQQNYIRAWHGHKQESKYVYCISGSAKICCVKIDNYKKPNTNQAIETFNLNENIPAILFIPKGYANGFLNTELNTSLIFFSDKTLEESKNDDYRFPFDYWNPWDIKFY